MAAHADQGGVVLDATEPFNDYDAHRTTYTGFLKLVKYVASGVIILLILMAIFLA